MELNWSTFALEIINFLVLVWILKRFLYKPVLDIIARRRSGIETRLGEAEQEQAEARNLKAQYEGRLAQWEQERARARETMFQELEQERDRKLAGLKAELDQEREKARVSEARRQADTERKLEETALAQGARFATRLLEQTAGPETESRLIELAIGDLEQLPAERTKSLRNHWATAPEAIVVTTAYPINDTQAQRLEQVIRRLTELNVPVRFTRDPALLAGVTITVGAWVLGACLRDELQGFAELSHAD